MSVITLTSQRLLITVREKVDANTSKVIWLSVKQAHSAIDKAIFRKQTHTVYTKPSLIIRQVFTRSQEDVTAPKEAIRVNKKVISSFLKGSGSAKKVAGIVGEQIRERDR